MSDKIGGIILVFWVLMALILLGVAVSLPTIDYSVTEAQVKVQEVGTRYTVLVFGEQHYIRVQNAYSDQFSSSSEAYEVCIEAKDIDLFRQAKNAKRTTNIQIKGNGLSTMWKCVTGDTARVIE